jgi:hypothetical protein
MLQATLRASNSSLAMAFKENAILKSSRDYWKNRAYNAEGDK